jgi:DNA (cytosine-5)-methyltransferase 1
MASARLPVISLFSGALGLDLGLEAAGFELAVAVECDPFAAKTIRTNRPKVPVIERRLEKVTTREILQQAGLKPGEAAVVTGGPSCQAFSTAGQRGSVSDPRGGMFRQFMRVVKEARPRFFVMENVKGVLSAAVRHRPLDKRGPGHRALDPAEQLGSALLTILRELRKTGYYIVFDLLNAADYGVPQARERVLFIGSRDGEPIWMPTATHAELPSTGLLPWVTLKQAIGRLRQKKPQFTRLPPSKAKYLKLVPTGGNWKDLPTRLQAEALGAAYVSWGGRSGFCRRLAWDRPAPALTTRPDSKATMLCHPTELRPLSIREYAAIQQFPRDWKLDGSIPQKYKQLGNAVPVGLGKAVGLALRSAMRKRKRVQGSGLIICADEARLARLAGRPQTVLNPQRMRKVKTLSGARDWMGGKQRPSLLRLVKTRSDVVLCNYKRRKKNKSTG